MLHGTTGNNNFHTGTASSFPSSFVERKKAMPRGPAVSKVANFTYYIMIGGQTLENEDIPN